MITIFAVGLSISLLTPSRSAISAKSDGGGSSFENYDIRLDTSVQARGLLDELSAPDDGSAHSDLADAAAEAERMKQEVPGSAIEWSSRSGFPEIISIGIAGKESALLTSPRGGSPTEALRSFIRTRNELFGIDAADAANLDLLSEQVDDVRGLTFVRLGQKIDGIAVFQGELTAGLNRQNQIFRVINDLAPLRSASVFSKDFGDASTALRNAALHVGISIGNASIRSVSDESGSIRLRTENNGFDADPIAERFYFPLPGSTLRPTWRFLISTKGVAYYVVVDAVSGDLMWRKRLTEYQSQPASFNVYGNSSGFTRTADSPTPGTPGCSAPGCPQPAMIERQTFTLIGNEPPYTFNNLGWIPDGENRTIGNNAEAGIDRDGTQGIDPNGWAFGSPDRSFVYAYNPSPGLPPPGEAPVPTTQTYPPSQFQQGSVTHAFYAVNRWHDETYRLGFTEASRNFQVDNFGRGGAGNDSISVEVQDGSGTNGANFSTPADGSRPRLQLFVWTGTNPARDGALDSQIVIHELTHGLSNRLIGNAAGLSSNMSRSLGEGWSDFFALAMLAEPADDKCGNYPIGTYSIQNVIAGSEVLQYYGLRRFPYARRACTGPNGRPHNPLTFRYINSGCGLLIGTQTSNPNSAYPRGPLGSGNCDQVLNAGEIWASALWEVRGQLIDTRGDEDGNRRSLQYVTDGMKLSPLNPTMLQGRDAMIVAAQAAAPEDVCPIWRGFAIRGFGVSASIQNAGSGSNNTVVTEAFDVPVACRASARADFDGDGRSDVSVYRPSEGIWYFDRSTAGFGAVRWGLAGDVPVPGDFDGDDKTDVAIFRPNDDGGSPDLYILRSSDSTFGFIPWGSTGDIPVVADHDGDGRSDAAVFRPSTGVFWVLRSIDGAPFTSRPFPGTIPVTGDFDGDGRSEFGVFSNGQWFLSLSSSAHSSGLIENWGINADLPVPADYDGDGRLDLAVFRPSDGTWYVRQSSGGNGYIRFGVAGDVPVPGDFDGDGRVDTAVYREGIWYINRSTAGISIQQFGLASDLAVPNYYLPR